MKSRARCVPLQYLSSATRGVKQALNFNKKPSNQNLFVVTTLLQEKNSEKNSIPLKAQQSSEEVSSAENKMYYELGNKRRMECELYQDCSWFQQDTMKGNINSKLSLAEVPEPILDPDEFDLAMQLANGQTIPWGDEYLEVFDHDINQDPEKLADKNKNLNSSSNFEDNVCDTYNVNFTLRKTDSFDSMKNISSTNPAEIIPISYKEKLNNSNYGRGILDNSKNCVKKEEVDLNSPDSNSYVMDSDDNDLIIGREEIVEELNSGNFAYETTKRDKISPDFDSADIPLSAILPIITPIESNRKIKEKYPFKPQKAIENAKKLPVKVENNVDIKQENEKLALNIDLAKVGIDQSMNVNTPDLDFMDLVEYINEEMHSDEIKHPVQQSENPNSTDSMKFQSAENQTNGTDSQPASQPQNESISPEKSSDGSINNTSSDSATVDLNQLSSGVSIAERIKTSAKRRTPRKYSVKDIQISEDEEDSFDEDDDDEDEDYDFTEDVTSRKSVSLRKRSKSSASESSSSGKKFKEDSGYVDSYRERRDKNNEASRRSRQNRKDRERLMYKTLEEEERRNVKLKAESDILEKQVTSLRHLLLQVVLKKGSVT